jgi:outer membrane protein assembly factor BamE (lipoprotein component of BamABCDE complex)
MKTLPYPILVLAGLILLAGCSTPEARIKNSPEAFDRCTPQQQELIKQGKIAIGFDEDMVRLALGDPERITMRTDASGQSEVWHYVTYETDEGVPLFMGYYHRFYGPVLYPYYLDYPARTEHDRFRVAFQAAKVVSIEEETNY